MGLDQVVTLARSWKGWRVTHGLPPIVALPSTVVETDVWPLLSKAIGGDGDGLTVGQRRWLTVARHHSSALYESRELSPVVSPSCLSLLENVGKSVLDLELTMAIGGRAEGWDVARRDAVKARVISSARRILADRLGVADHGLFGSGERQMLLQQVARGQVARSYEAVALQLLGWWSLLLAGRRIRALVHDIYSVQASAAEDIRDWRSIFEKNFSRLSPEYSVTEVGPDHSRSFEVLLTTRDGRSAVGAGQRKKQAVQRACQAYLVAHAQGLLNRAEPAGSSALPRTDGRALPIYTEHRRLAREFGSSDPYLFAKALTHSSWVYENISRGDTRLDSNAVLANLGSAVLATCFTRTRASYLLNTSGKPDPDISLTLTLPDSDLRPLAAALGLPAAALLGAGQRTVGVSDEMAANFVQATLAAAFVQAPEWSVFESRLPVVVSRFLLEQSSRSLLDPVTLMQELAAELQFTWQEDSDKTGPDHRSEYQVTVRLIAGDSVVTAAGCGPSLKSARKQAAQTVLDADHLRTGDAVEGDRDDIARLLIERQLAALATRRSRWQQLQRRNALGARYVAAGQWESFGRWNLEMLRAIPVTSTPPPDALETLAEYYGDAVRRTQARPQFAATLTQVVDWIRSTEEDDRIVLQDRSWNGLLALSAAQAVWLSPNDEADLVQVLQDWALLNKKHFAVGVDAPTDVAPVDKRSAAAILRILQQSTPAALGPRAPVRASLSSGPAGHVVRLLAEHNWTRDPLESPVIALVCETTPYITVARAGREVRIKIGNRTPTSSGGWLWAAARQAYNVDDYDHELGALIHNLKNEVTAARVALNSSTTTRTQRREADLAASKHLDAAMTIASRLADVDMLYTSAAGGTADLAMFLRSYTGDLIRTLPPTVRVIPPTTPPAVVAVSGSVLRGLLDNLVKNAVEAMHNEGDLAFDYTVVSGDNLVLLEVRDTGPGLPPQVIQALRSGASVPSSKRHGSGLGLPSVMRVLRRLGGDLQPLDTTAGGWLVALPLTLPTEEENSPRD
ncbi:ATP-binding protein [Micromonospora chaiyaphumensis]|uniref:histidine kinase n=1 Tax=Micromonospora chaiyaphumensis TaxID=307119 RepID=A0A1C4W813_9ACTN|nr:ATP-binding protein [Micromonospora chaiyaphumensis]SCE92249.1 dsRNA-specific ribonuclease [Micromonospora chaiyaphumensis]